MNEANHNKKTGRHRRKKRRPLRLVIPLLLVAGAAYALFTYVLGVAIVRGDMMAPSISNADLVLYLKVGVTYDIGDVVVANVDGETVIDRIVATGDDIVAFDADGGAPLVNGAAVDGNMIIGKTYSRGDSLLSVSRQSVYLLGDNREEATDSRDFGAVSTFDIVGRVFFVARGM